MNNKTRPQIMEYLENQKQASTDAAQSLQEKVASREEPGEKAGARL